jgi:hypothetical protein
MLQNLTESLTQAVDTKQTEHLRSFVVIAAKMPIVGDILYGALKDDDD